MDPIKETTITPRTYIVWRKEIKIDDITDQEMWQTAFGKVNEYIQKNNLKYAGPGAAIYFTWDTEKGASDFAIGMPVNGVSEVSEEGLSLVEIESSAASVMTLHGDYSQLREGHSKMMDYLREQAYTPTLTIEEYTVTGIQMPEPKDWETNLYYLHN
jgi:effector-binding domain-containing protein